MSPNAIQPPPTQSACRVEGEHARSSASAAHDRADQRGQRNRRPRSVRFNGTAYGRSRSGAVTRSRTIERCAIVVASSAPKAYTPARNLMSPGTASARASSVAIPIAT